MEEEEIVWEGKVITFIPGSPNFHPLIPPPVRESKEEDPLGHFTLSFSEP